MRQAMHYQKLGLIPIGSEREKKKGEKKARSAPVSSSLSATISLLNVTFTFLLLLFQNVVGSPPLLKYDSI